MGTSQRGVGHSGGLYHLQGVVQPAGNASRYVFAWRMVCEKMITHAYIDFPLKPASQAVSHVFVQFDSGLSMLYNLRWKNLVWAIRQKISARDGCSCQRRPMKMGAIRGSASVKERVCGNSRHEICRCGCRSGEKKAVRNQVAKKKNIFMAERHTPHPLLFRSPPPRSAALHANGDEE